MHLVPWDYDFTKEHFDGLFISNGPGDPAMVHTTINNISQVTTVVNCLPLKLYCKQASLPVPLKNLILNPVSVYNSLK